MRRLICLFSLMISILQFGFAQEQLGSISGTVTDSTGAVIKEATVEVLNLATNLKVTVKTQSNGFYIVPDLPIGTYAVTISRSGFRTEKHSQVLVQADRAATVPAKLEVGQVETMVEVRDTPLLNQSDNSIGYILPQEVIENTPLGTGSFTQL